MTLADVAGEPFIAYNTDRRLRDLQMQAFTMNGVSPTVAHSADSTESILAFVAAGLGVSLVGVMDPKGPRVSGVVTWPLLRPAASFPIQAIWRKVRTPNPLVAAALGLAPTPG